MEPARTTSGLLRVFGEGVDVLRRYGPGGSQSLMGQVRTNRNMIRFASTQVLHPFRFKAALGAYRDALVRQRELFLTQRVDDVTDAMRHAGTSALVVDRIARRGTRPDVAGEFMRRLGRAHELDSELAGAHRAASEAMDLHNNELGISMALEHLAATSGPSSRAGEQALEGAVLRALADGRGLVLDAPTAPVRASTADDLARVLRDPSRIA
jgi:hypothetical protein